jgi:two-component system OmpR family response regulator
MPNMDGLALCRAVRASERFANLPVVLVTSLDSPDARERGLAAGADAYVGKASAGQAGLLGTVRELLARLRALIRRSAGKASPKIEIDDVVVDTASRTVAKNGQQVALTASEYSLVELLALHRGELVSRSMIYDHLFDENDDTLSNLTDVHVSNIRKKLGKNFIVTRRGQGYLIDPQDAANCQGAVE